MSTSNNKVLVGIFKEMTQAEDAIILLKDVGLSDDQLGSVMQKDSSGGKRLHDILLNLNIAEEEARYYASEFGAGRSIVVVKHNGRRAEVLNILLLNRARLHRYLNMEHVDNAPISLQEGSSEQLQASHGSVSGKTTTNTSTNSTHTRAQDEMASVYRLLKDVGLEYLL